MRVGPGYFPECISTAIHVILKMDSSTLKPGFHLVARRLAIQHHPNAMTYPNPEQAAVLNHLHGTLLVLAPAGTGKTRLMADRLAAVIATGMPPELTLGVTFTNRAAEHMRAAVRESCGDHAKHCRIQTFHGLCAWILRIEARDLGLPSDFVNYDEEVSIDLLRVCLRGTYLKPDAAFWQLSQIKSDCPAAVFALAHCKSPGV